jgi:uncharacterized membrane protein YqhA
MMEPPNKPVGNLTGSSSGLSDSTIQSAQQSKTLKSPPEAAFESVLWSSRFVVLIAVFASVVVAVAIFYVSTVDTSVHLKDVIFYAKTPVAEHEAMRTSTISNVVEAIDGYLLGTVMLIFAFGLYEMFISRIDRVGKEDRARVLMIHSLDDLKNRLGQVILLILVVKFFESSLALSYKSLLDLLILSVGILLIAAALYLTHKQNHEQ